MDSVIVLRDLIIVDVDDRAALAQHMHDGYALAGDAQQALSRFRQHRSPSDLKALEQALDRLQGRLFLLECGLNS